jgi:ribosomal protein S25
MAATDQIFQDLTPGMKLTISGAMSRYRMSYSTAQKAMRHLWIEGFLKRQKVGRVLEYEGKQERLV